MIHQRRGTHCVIYPILPLGCFSIIILCQGIMTPLAVKEPQDKYGDTVIRSPMRKYWQVIVCDAGSGIQNVSLG